MVSLMNCSEIEQFTIIEVMKLPVKESFSSLVNFESLNGIWSVLFLVVRALMTLPRQERDEFIFFVYSKASP